MRLGLKQKTNVTGAFMSYQKSTENNKVPLCVRQVDLLS